MTNIAKDFSVSNFYGHYWGLSSAFHTGISFYADTDRPIPHQQMKIYIPFQFCYIFYITYMTAIGMRYYAVFSTSIIQKERRSGNHHFKASTCALRSNISEMGRCCLCAPNRSDCGSAPEQFSLLFYRHTVRRVVKQPLLTASVKSSHVSFYTASLGMMVKAWALVTTPSFLVMKHLASPHSMR